ncbi:MAG: antitermination protein NusG [Phycisphaerae bacterium]|nr:antitermination protein NusG [Phycisphaerae bacterium]
MFNASPITEPVREFERIIAVRPAGRWWVAHTRSRHEKVLAEHLDRLGIACYLPLCRRVTRSRRTRRISRSEVPVFPGYLFFVGDDEQRHRAMSTNHIAQTIAVSDQTTLIHQLLQVDRALRSGEPITRSARLAAGDAVRVIAGPLHGLEGVVVRWRSRVRVVLNVETLGQSVSIEVDADTVERV